MKPLVIYHDKCTDGFGAAFAAWMKLGDDAEYLPMSYGSGWAPGDEGRVDRTCQERDVYMLDFSCDRSIMNQLIVSAKKFVWLDHHKTAFEMWTGGSLARHEEIHDAGHYILLDNNRSGAMLAWEHFHPDTAVPALIQRIDDRDRWVFQYDDSRALHAGLRALGHVFKKWEMLVPMGTIKWGRNYDGVVDAGLTILSVYDEQVKDRVKVAEKCTVPAGYIDPNGVPQPSTIFAPLPGLAVNSPIHQSEIGNELAKASGAYGLVWYYDAATKRANVSLRSIGDYDVSAIAKAFGGGGHKNAAGFNIDMGTLLGWLK